MSKLRMVQNFFQGAQESRLVRTFQNLFSKILIISIPYGWHILFFLIPFAIVFFLSFSQSVLQSPPYLPIMEFLDESFINIRLNIGNYKALWHDSIYINSYIESIRTALIATLGCLLLGYPLAYGITQSTPIARTIFLMLVILPFWTSFLVRVYAWMGILGSGGPVNSLLMNLGIISEPIAILNTNFAVILGLIYSYLPFMVLPLYASLEKIDRTLLEAAYDLGCKPFTAFFKIVVPLSYRGIVGGSMLVFIPGVGEYVIPALLGGSDSLMIGKVLWNEFFVNHDWPLAAALVMTLFSFLVIPLILLQKSLSRIQGEEA